MPFRVANGLRFNTFDLGPPGAPGVVMLHGLLVGNLATWYFTGARRLAKNKRVFLYDLRGHGRSERASDGYTVGAMCDDLEALLQGASDLGRPLSLVGHSFGALIALEFARRHPDGVHKLVLVEAPIPPSTTGALIGWLSLPKEELVGALPDELRGAVVTGGRRASRLLSALHFLAYETTLLQDIGTDWDAPDKELAAAIPHPTLCVYGRTSSCLVGGERLARVLPAASLRILEGGHYLPVENAGELTEAIVEFLDG